MEIVGKTLYEFLPVYLAKYRPEIGASPTRIRTINNILESFKDVIYASLGTKVTMKQISAKSGYSRTTIYVYFKDIKDIQNMLEELVIYHTEVNAPIFDNTLKNLATHQERKSVIQTMNNFHPFIHALNLYDNTFRIRYQDAFTNIFFELNKNGPIEYDPMLNSVVCASIVNLIYLDTRYSDYKTLKRTMRIMNVINQAILTYSESLRLQDEAARASLDPAPSYKEKTL